MFALTFSLLVLVDNCKAREGEISASKRLSVDKAF